jgi:hypothetical protein
MASLDDTWENLVEASVTLAEERDKLALIEETIDQKVVDRIRAAAGGASVMPADLVRASTAALTVAALLRQCRTEIAAAQDAMGDYRQRLLE